MAKSKIQDKEINTAEGPFKRGKAVVVPTLSVASMNEGDSLFVEFTSEPVTKMQTNAKGEAKIDPDTGEHLKITTAQVIDLTTGALGEVVLGFIVCKALANYDGLVGRRFEMVKGKKKNRTTMWEVYELDAD